jgi:hypothetical protein
VIAKLYLTIYWQSAYFTLSRCGKAGKAREAIHHFHRPPVKLSRTDEIVSAATFAPGVSNRGDDGRFLPMTSMMKKMLLAAATVVVLATPATQAGAADIDRFCMEPRNAYSKPCADAVLKRAPLSWWSRSIFDSDAVGCKPSPSPADFKYAYGPGVILSDIYGFDPVVAVYWPSSGPGIEEELLVFRTEQMCRDSSAAAYRAMQEKDAEERARIAAAKAKAEAEAQAKYEAAYLAAAQAAAQAYADGLKHQTFVPCKGDASGHCIE